MSDSDNSSKTPLILGVVLAMVLAGALVFFFAYRSQVAHVSGMVTLDNQPLGGALVVFISESDPNGTPLAVQTEGDGSYRLIGNTGSGIPTGKYNPDFRRP